MTKEFIHFSIPKKVDTISGHYELIQEKVIEYKGRELLYYMGYGIVDTSCCGFGGCGYALVIGFVEEYKALKNKEGLFVSRICEIKDFQRADIDKFLKNKEMVYQVVFL